MKKSTLLLLCGCVALAGIFQFCSKQALVDFSGPSGSFRDARNGHVYKWVKIGDQVWMAENLAYLPEVSPAAEGSHTDPYYYVYGYDGTTVSEAKATDNYNTYGVLYNWPAAMNASPAGWHLPTDEEWTELEYYLITNGYNYDGTKTYNKIAKAMTTSFGWTSSSVRGSAGNTDYPDKRNQSGFSALPGGTRYLDGNFYAIGKYGYWWSSTEYHPSEAWYRLVLYSYCYVHRYPNNNGGSGFSVRCLRD